VIPEVAGSKPVFYPTNLVRNPSKPCLLGFVVCGKHWAIVAIVAIVAELQLLEAREILQITG
jgi:hypothetical protein